MSPRKPIRVPAPADLRAAVEAIEKATDCKILVVQGDLKMDEKAQDAAILAASIVFNDNNPSGDWEVEADGYRKELADMCGLPTTWSPFVPEECPLSAQDLEKALSYLREIIGLNQRPGLQQAIDFIAWAKRTALDS